MARDYRAPMSLTASDLGSFLKIHGTDRVVVRSKNPRFNRVHTRQRLDKPPSMLLAKMHSPLGRDQSHWINMGFNRDSISHKPLRGDAPEVDVMTSP